MMLRSMVADGARWISLQDLLTWLRDPDLDSRTPAHVRTTLVSLADTLEEYGDALDTEIDRDCELQRLLGGRSGDA